MKFGCAGRVHRATSGGHTPPPPPAAPDRLPVMFPASGTSDCGYAFVGVLILCRSRNVWLAAKLIMPISTALACVFRACECSGVLSERLPKTAISDFRSSDYSLVFRESKGC
jgi:hypothetical protein